MSKIKAHMQEHIEVPTPDDTDSDFKATTTEVKAMRKLKPRFIDLGKGKKGVNIGNSQPTAYPLKKHFIFSTFDKDAKKMTFYISPVIGKERFIKILKTHNPLLVPNKVRANMKETANIIYFELLNQNPGFLLIAEKTVSTVIRKGNGKGLDWWAMQNKNKDANDKMTIVKKVNLFKIEAAAPRVRKTPAPPIEGVASTEKFKFGGVIYGNGALVLAIIKKEAEANPEQTVAQLEAKYPAPIMGGFGVFKPLATAKKLSGDKYKRYFFEKTQLVTVGGKVCAVCNQWTGEKIARFIAAARTAGHVIE